MKYFVASKLSENISETPEGYLLCLGVPIARCGEMVYGEGESPIKPGPDGKSIVSRDSKELFKPETIASFEGKPFTIKHPEDFVNPSNWKQLSCGIMFNVRIGKGEFASDLLADILVTDDVAIRLVKGGMREVSCGYEAEYIETGVGRGLQTNILGNHLALVDAGRAGSVYAINDQKQGAKMKKLGDRIKSIWAKAADEAAKVVDEAKEETTETTPGEKAPAWATKLEKTMARVADALMTAGASTGQPSKYSDEEKEDDKDKKSKDKSKDADKDEDKDKSKDADKDDEKKDDAKDADKEDDKDKSKDEGGMEARLSKMEDMMGKICDALEIGGEEAGDEEGEEEEESEDDDFEETPAGSSDKAMDEKSRIEILAPGFKGTGKDAKRGALIESAKVADNAAVIKRLNGGKDIDLKKASSKTIDHLFIGASEVVGLFRTKDFVKSKQVRDSQEGADHGGQMSVEKINEINAKHYQGAH